MQSSETKDNNAEFPVRGRTIKINIKQNWKRSGFTVETDTKCKQIVQILEGMLDHRTWFELTFFGAD